MASFGCFRFRWHGRFRSRRGAALPQRKRLRSHFADSATNLRYPLAHIFRFISETRTMAKTMARTLALITTAILVASACSDPAPQPPRGVVEATLGKLGAPNCPASGDWLNIGNLSRPDIPVTQPVQDGTTYEGKGVTIRCRVTQTGNTFAFTAEASMAGEGSVRFSNANVTLDGTSKVQAVFARSDYGRFSQDDCEFTAYHPGGSYDATVDGKPTKLPDIAPGRIWGKVTCTKATLGDQDPPKVCNGAVNFRFENCEQT